MPELPNLLRQRLAATENGETQTHPDADTLTAYMEHALPAAESKTVVAHLSVCEPCREVVALSQAGLAELETQTVLAPAPVARWRKLFTPVFARGRGGCHGRDCGDGASASTEKFAAFRAEYSASESYSPGRTESISRSERTGDCPADGRQITGGASGHIARSHRTG